ncbi:hypothetical protein OSTOST_23377 [Ostertagia ostertagi]
MFANTKFVSGDRWQAKISDYGLRKMRVYDKRLPQDLLWTAPEVLRKDEMIGSKEADIYSFGIICGQLVTKTSAWDLDNRTEDAAEILYLVKKGGHNQERPSLGDKDEFETTLLCSTLFVTVGRNALLKDLQ